MRAYSPKDSIDNEQPLLLNPWLDDFTKHLSFIPSTEEAGGYAVGITDKGKIYIKILALNRADLIYGRSHQQRIVRTFLKERFMKSILEEDLDGITEIVAKIEAREYPFATAVYYEINDFFHKMNLPFSIP